MPTSIKRRFLPLGTAAALAVLAACSDTPEVALDGLSDQEIFARAEMQLEAGQSDLAAQSFGEIERLYPYSELTERALIMQAFAFHRDGDYDNSRASAQRFLQFFPDSGDAPYAAYLLALSYYDQIDDIGRDQGLTVSALEALTRVIEGYPGSPYAADAQQKFRLAFAHLAGKEMDVGRYYLKRGHYAAAANRFRVVVEDFQTTVHTPEALHRLVESYLALGLEDEARTAAAILGHNYQGSEWYDASYALLTGQGLEPGVAGTGWLTAIYRQVVLGQWL